MSNSIKLTLGVTCYYNSDVNKLKELFYSLFVDKSSKFILNNETKIELLIIIDGADKNLYNKERIIQEINNINKYVKKYCIVRYIITKNNIKVSRARNLIINKAYGEYIAFCDDDDLRIDFRELLKIIDNNSEIDYISHYFFDEKKQKSNKIQISNLSCWCSIIKTKFLRNNKLYFTPDLASEDVIWRSNLDYIIGIKPIKTSQIEDICYTYKEPSNRSLINNNKSRFLDNITINELKFFQIKNSELFINVNKILSQYLDIGFKITEWRLYSLCSSIAFNKAYPLIKYWMNINKKQIEESVGLTDRRVLIINENLIMNNEIEQTNDIINTESKQKEVNYDLKMLEYSNILSTNIPDNLFFKLSTIQQFNCLTTYIKYITLEDLRLFAEYLDSIDLLQVLDSLWNSILDVNVYKNKISTYKQFNEFVYRYMSLLYLKEGLFKKIVNIKILNEMHELYQKELINNTPRTEICNFIHDLSLRNTDKSDMYNFINEGINEGNLLSSYELITKFNSLNMFQEEILKFNETNNIKSTKLGKYDIHYKGPINVFLFYLLTPMPEEKINDDVCSIIKNQKYKESNNETKIVTLEKIYDKTRFKYTEEMKLLNATKRKQIFKIHGYDMNFYNEFVEKETLLCNFYKEELEFLLTNNLDQIIYPSKNYFENRELIKLLKLCLDKKIKLPKKVNIDICKQLYLNSFINNEIDEYDLNMSLL